MSAWLGAAALGLGLGLGLGACAPREGAPLDGASTDAVADTTPTEAGNFDAEMPGDSSLIEAATDAPRVAPPPRFLTDREGRALLLHGLNVDSHAKGDPERSPRLTESDVARMATQWGFGIARYLVFWDQLEPQPGRIDEAYLARIATRLDWFARHGVYVVLDLHQDVYAARFCCDGAPEWAIRSDGQPFALQPQWFQNYQQPAVLRAFDNFWNDTGPHADLQTHYGDVLAALARRFHAHPAVLGYDVMNEPSGGTAFDAIEAAQGRSRGVNSAVARFDRERLVPFYQRMIGRIRAEDPDGYVFVEPRYGAAANGAEQHWSVLSDPRPGEPRVVYAPHLYSLSYEAVMRYVRGTDRTVPRWIDARNAERVAQNWPVFIGEWGLDQTFAGATDYDDDVLAMADSALLGWTYWSADPGSWGPIDGDPPRETALLERLVRTYPQRVGGTPRALRWNRETRTCVLDFDTREGVRAPTVFFVPKSRFYSRGFIVECSDPAGRWSQRFDEATQRLEVTVDPTIASHRITIRPME